jgi:hypothetical protein
MTREHGLIDRESWQPFFSLLLFCGIGLLLTIPPAWNVRQFGTITFLPGVPIYMYSYSLFMGILGLNLGAISAVRGEWGWQGIGLLTGRILLAQCLVLPYFVFARALYPGKEVAFVLIIFYTTIVALLCATTSRLIEGPPHKSAPRGFLLKYAGYIIYCVIPFLGLPILSPLGAVARILDGESSLVLLMAYTVPFFMLLLVMVVLHWQYRRGIHD